MRPRPCGGPSDSVSRRYSPNIVEDAFSEVRAGLRQMASCFCAENVTTRRHCKQGAIYLECGS